MLNAIFRTLEKWPGEPTGDAWRRNSPFKSPYAKTLDLLEYELNQLAAYNVVVQVQMDRSQIRNDGWPRSDARVNGPGVILSFRGSDANDYVYPCDTFLDWRDNLRAIALALEALRKIDRYGVTRRGEQYQGFRALPPGGDEQQRTKMTADQAAAWIAEKIPGVSAEGLLGSRRLFEAVFKLGQQQMHPDAGGAHEDFVMLQEAGAVLKERFSAKGAPERAGGSGV